MVAFNSKLDLQNDYVFRAGLGCDVRERDYMHIGSMCNDVGGAGLSMQIN